MKAYTVPLTWLNDDHGFCLRIFGWGLNVVDHRKSRPYFSDRNHLFRRLHIGPWCIRPMTPWGDIRRKSAK